MLVKPCLHIDKANINSNKGLLRDCVTKACKNLCIVAAGCLADM